MLEELRSLEYMNRVTFQRRDVCVGAGGDGSGTATALLHAATRNGAAALRMSGDVGCIAEGFLADFAAVDLTHPTLEGVANAHMLGALVFGCSAECVVAETCVSGVWQSHRPSTAAAPVDGSCTVE